MRDLKDFNTVDSFDTHAKIPQHFANVDEAAKASGKTAIISVGWEIFTMKANSRSVRFQIWILRCLIS